MSSAWDIIDHVLETCAPEPEMRTGWRCRRDGGCHRSAEDPAWAGRPFLELTGSFTSYVTLAATVEFDRSRLHLTQQDAKTGGGDQTWDLPLDEATLEALRRAAWPEPGDRPWF